VMMKRLIVYAPAILHLAKDDTDLMSLLDAPADDIEGKPNRRNSIHAIFTVRLYHFRALKDRFTSYCRLDRYC